MANKIDSIDANSGIQNAGNTRALSGSQTIDETTRFGTEPNKIENRSLFQLTSADLKRSDLMGFSFNAYEMGRRLGQGGMGQVFLATHAKLGKPFAVKFISSEVRHDPQATARFEQEATALGKLEHPNLVRATDAGLSDGLHFIITEYVEGQNLTQWVEENGPVDLPVACDWIRQAAQGLMHATQRGVIHRDIKPSNLIIDSQGTIRVIDFGLAALSDQVEGVTVQGQILGTLDFLAPEQAENARNASVRSDIYSLGCTLYFLVTGVAPFTGPRYGTVASKIHAHRYETPLPLQRFGILSPKGFQTLLDRMLAKNAAERFQNYDELLKQLSSFSAPVNSRKVDRIEGRTSSISIFPRANESLIPQAQPAFTKALIVAAALLGAFAACFAFFVVGSNRLWLTSPKIAPGIPVRTLGQSEANPSDLQTDAGDASASVVVAPSVPTSEAEVSTLSVEEEAEEEDEATGDSSSDASSLDEDEEAEEEGVDPDDLESANEESDESDSEKQEAPTRPLRAKTQAFREAKKTNHPVLYPAFGDKKFGSRQKMP